MSVIKLISLAQKADWDSALSDIGHSAYHTWWYCNALQKSQPDPIELLRVEKGGSGLVAIFCKRSKDSIHFDIYSPYGFGGILYWGELGAEVDEIFKQWLNKNNIITAYLMSHPVFENKNYELLQPHRTAFVLDLTQSYKALWSNMRSSHKSEINKVLKNDSVTITDNKEEILEVFPELYNITLERVGAGKSYHFTEATQENFFLSKQTLAIAGKIDNLIHAVILIIYNSNCAEYFINATNDSGRHLSRLLLWKSIEILKEKNIPKYHLGGGSEEGDHLEAFKRRFGGEKLSIPIYKQISNVDMYAKFCERLDVDPNEQTYFPPYWKN